MLYQNITSENSRADKETRYGGFYLRSSSVEVKERRSIDLIKFALLRSERPVISCSFGIDSVLDVYLTRKALIELGRDPSDIDIIWNDTANEFKEVRQFQKYITELWDLRLIITKPKRTLKHIIERNGGITNDYFTSRKGKRSSGKPLSEKCCNTLKHEPMIRAIKLHNWDLVIVGLRADESSQRLQAGLRDGEYFYSTYTWKSYVLRPILWWTEDNVWEYVEKNSIPYNDLYNMNLLKESVDGVENQTRLSRKEAYVLKKQGYDLFTPRTGCMMCPIPIKYGYMQWMRLNYPKVFEAMVHNLGYGSALINMIPAEVRDEIEQLLGISINAENVHEHLQDILTAKPCTFDKL